MVAEGSAKPKEMIICITVSKSEGGGGRRCVIMKLIWNDLICIL